MSTLDLDAMERNAAGWRGEFVYRDAWEADRGIGDVADCVTFDAGIWYIPDGADLDDRYPTDDGCTLISTELDKDVAEHLVERLNAPTPLIEQLRAALQRVAELEQAVDFDKVLGERNRVNKRIAELEVIVAAVADADPDDRISLINVTPMGGRTEYIRDAARVALGRARRAA